MKIDAGFLIRFAFTCAAIFAAALSPAHAASFDCAKAKTGIEKAICADADVSRQDGLLQETYQKLLAESTDPEKFKAEQRAWVKERDKCRGEEPDKTICLSLAYYARRGALETELFLNQRSSAENAMAHHPDMWSARLEDSLMRVSGRVFKFDQALQQKLGLDSKIDDYFFLDFQPGWKTSGGSEYVLRGFFSGVVVPVSSPKRKTSPLVSGGVPIPSETEVPSLPLPEATKNNPSVGVSKGAKLRFNKYYLWHTGMNQSDGPDPCERAIQALELVDGYGHVIWSNVYILDAAQRWARPCGGIGDPDAISAEELEFGRKLVTYYWNDAFYTNDASLPRIYSLDDGTFFILSDAYLLRLRLSNGQFDRAGVGMVALDAMKMMNFKREFKTKWEMLHNESQQKLFDCVGKSSIAEQKYLAKTKCKKFFDDPYAFDYWYHELNAEIERTFLYPTPERGKAK